MKPNGAKFTADTLLLGGYAQIVTSNGGLAFTDLAAPADDPSGTPVPEPASLSIPATDLLGIGGLHWQRGKGV